MQCPFAPAFFTTVPILLGISENSSMIHHCVCFNIKKMASDFRDLSGTQMTDGMTIENKTETESIGFGFHFVGGYC